MLHSGLSGHDSLTLCYNAPGPNTRELVHTPGNSCTEGCRFANRLVHQSKQVVHHNERPFLGVANNLISLVANFLLTVDLALKPLFEFVNFHSDNFILGISFLLFLQFPIFYQDAPFQSVGTDHG